MILNNLCGLLNMLKLIQMLSVMIRIPSLAKTGDFPKYAFLFRVSVFSALPMSREGCQKPVREVWSH